MKHFLTQKLSVYAFIIVMLAAQNARAAGLPSDASATTAAAGTAETARAAAGEKNGSQTDKQTAAGRITGLVLERGTRAPLSGAQVILPDLATETYTDGDGSFAFDGVPAGETAVFLPGDDHQPLRIRIKVPSTGELKIVLRPERKSYVLYRSAAVAPPAAGEPTKQSISKEEIAKVPGTYGDSFKVISNLPGVARTGGFSGQIVVRGSAPTDTQTMVEGINIPQLYHFGGLYSVFNTDLLTGIEFQAGPQAARVGRRTGGLIEAKLALPPAESTWHATVEANAFHAGAIVSGGLSPDTHVTLAARRSYIDGLLATVVPAGVLPFVAVPRYYDYQAKVDHRFSAHTNATLLLFGSDDSLRAVVDKPPAAFPSARGGINAATAFVGGIGVLRYGGESWRGQTTVGAVPSSVNVALGSAIAFNLKASDYTLRQDFSRQFSGFKLRAGMDWLWTPYEISLQLPYTPGTGEPGTGSGAQGKTVSLVQKGSFYAPAVWTDAVLVPFKHLELVAGLRLDFFRGYSKSDAATVIQRIDQTVSPRLALREKLNDNWTLKASAGLSSQKPEPQQLGALYGNPDLRAIRAGEINVGAEWRASEALVLDAQLFDKNLWNLVVVNPNWPASGAPYSNDGVGHVRGLELLVRHKPIGQFFGWISYTLQRAVRVDHPGEVERLFGWDQTHIFTALGSYKFTGNWEVGARWRYTTGSPVTGIETAIWNGSDDTWSRVSSTCVNCQRLPAFHQLDVRVDKTWAFNQFVLAAYLDVQNVYNRANAESIQYSFDARQKTYASGLPIIPSFGLRGEF